MNNESQPTSIRWIGVVATLGVIVVLALLVSSPLFKALLGGSEAAIRNGQAEIPAIAEFVELYPNATHFISYYTGQYGQPRWNSEVGLYGRYVLTVQCSIEFDWTRRHIESHGPLTFYLQEITGIQGRSINHGQSSTFRLAEWDRLLESEGDLSILDMPITENKPIPGFDAVWRTE